MTTQKDDFFNEDNEAKANWFKFEKIGDAIKGTLINTSIRQAHENFPEQTVYELKLEDGSVMNVGSSKDFVRNAMKRAKIGQIVGFRYDSDFQTPESKKKGFAPAKTIKVYMGDMDPNYDMMEGMGKVVTEDEINVEDVPFK